MTARAAWDARADAHLPATTPDRCEVQYGVLWHDGEVEPADTAAAADRALSFGGGQGVVVKRCVRTVYGAWGRA